MNEPSYQHDYPIDQNTCKFCKYGLPDSTFTYGHIRCDVHNCYVDTTGHCIDFARTNNKEEK